MTREELIHFMTWWDKRYLPARLQFHREKDADKYLAEHPLPPAEGAETCWNCGIDLLHAPDGVTKYHCICGATNPGERPTAEGAEKRTRVRNILQDFYRRSDYELEQAEEDIMRLFPPQPTAEGAEEIRKEYSEESLNFFRSFIKARKELCAISPTETYSLEEAIRKAFDGFFPRPLSIIDDAEKILYSHPYLKVWIENLYDSEMKVCSIEQAIWAIEKAATLHAQRIADKMVSERLRTL